MPTMQVNGAMQGAGWLLMILLGGWGIMVTIYWMVVAWMAMRAHQQLADAVERNTAAIDRIANRAGDALELIRHSERG